MGSSTVSSMVDGQQEKSGIYRTIQAINNAGSIIPYGTIESIEELK